MFTAIDQEVRDCLYAAQIVLLYYYVTEKHVNEQFQADCEALLNFFKTSEKKERHQTSIWTNYDATPHIDDIMSNTFPENPSQFYNHHDKYNVNIKKATFDQFRNFILDCLSKVVQYMTES